MCPIPNQNLMGAAPVEQNALNGGGASNKQQISNFMTALNNVGAGGSNTQMQNAAPPPQQGPQQLVDPNLANQANGVTTQGGNGGAMMQVANWQPPAQTSNIAAAGPSMQMAPGMANPNNNPPLTPQTAQLLNQTQQANMASQPGVTNAVQGARSMAMAPQPANNGVVGQNLLPNLNNTAVNAINNVLTPTPAPQIVMPSAPMTANNSSQGAMLAAGAARPLVSDENAKTDVKKADRSLSDFMRQAGAHSYEYKKPELDGQGTFFGPMAQELQGTAVGNTTVIDTPRGKAVDTGRLALVNTSALSVLSKEHDRLQKQFDALKKNIKR